MAYINYREFQCMDVTEQKKSEAFVRELCERVLLNKTNQKGVLLKKDSTELDCKIKVGTNLDGNGNSTLGVYGGYFVTKGSDISVSKSNNIDKSSIILGRLRDQDNLDVLDIASKTSEDQSLVIVSPQEETTEVGAISITASSQQISSTLFDLTLLRDHSTGAPMKVRFKKSDGTSLQNNMDYEVIEVISSTAAIISGSLVDESGLEMEVIGSFDLNEQMNLTGKHLFSYVTGLISFVAIGASLTPYQIPLAMLTFDGSGGFTIEDLRQTNLLLFNNEQPSKVTPIKKTADYTFKKGDEDGLFQSDSVNALIFTIPLNANEAFAIGSTINLLRYNTGTLTIEGASGVLLRYAELATLRKQYSAASIIKIDTDEWLLTGDITLI